jgi:hypothetical protein
LHVENLPQDEWWIHTLLEFGAGNWILGLQFKNGSLSATRVRVADGDFHPSGRRRTGAIGSTVERAA